jgi:glycosyltransferase involved in cell wall biosynthesis
MNKMNEIVSVIMPFSNVEKYLQDSINSINRQTFKKWHLYLIDDGSTDSSSEIAYYYGKTFNNITYIRRKKSGICAALNTGIEYSKGRLLARADADDIYHNLRLAAQLSELGKTNSDIIGTNAIFIDENSRKLCNANIPNSFAHIRQLLLEGNATAVMHGCMMSSKDSIVKAGCYEVGTEGWEDIHLYLRLLQSDKIFANVRQRLYLMRKHTGSATAYAGKLNYIDKRTLYINKVRSKYSLPEIDIPKELPNDDVGIEKYWYNLAKDGNNIKSRIKYGLMISARNPSHLIRFIINRL